MYVKQIYKSSRPGVFCKKVVLRNFVKFTVKHLCQSPFSNKVAGLSPATLLKKRPWRRCFPVNFAKFPIIHFFTEHLWWLLLTTGENFWMFCTGNFYDQTHFRTVQIFTHLLDTWSMVCLFNDLSTGGACLIETLISRSAGCRCNF